MYALLGLARRHGEEPLDPCAIALAAGMVEVRRLEPMLQPPAGSAHAELFQKVTFRQAYDAIHGGPARDKGERRVLSSAWPTAPSRGRR